MKNILILYASSSGSTEQIANLLKEQLVEGQFIITKKEIGYDDINPNDLHNYDGILFGTYSYDDGDVPYEVEDFYYDLEYENLSGKIVGVFGSGDTSYPSFCGAVDVMKEKFELAHATVIKHTVKVDLYPDSMDELISIDQLARQFNESFILPKQAKPKDYIGFSQTDLH